MGGGEVAEMTLPTYVMVASAAEGARCPQSSARTHKTAFTTVEECALTCMSRAACNYISTNDDWCIGCSEYPGIADEGWPVYFVKPTECDDSSDDYLDCLTMTNTF